MSEIKIIEVIEPPTKILVTNGVKGKSIVSAEFVNDDIVFTNDANEEIVIEGGKTALQGSSSYQVWLDEGNEGTVEEYLASLVGTQGKSAYELAVIYGYTGTEEEFSLMVANKVDKVELYETSKHHLATKYLLSQLKSGKSVSVLGIGDSTMTTSSLWLGKLFKKFGEDYGVNVKHAQYNYGKTDYDAWENLHIAGVERGLRNAGSLAPFFLSVDEISVTSPDLDFSLNVSLDLWKNSQVKYLINRWGSAGSRCWSLFIGSNNTFYLMWSANGTDTAATANFNTVSLANNVDGQPYWYRFTVDVDDGAGHYVAKCWTSLDGSTWTVAQTITGVTTTSIFNSPTQGYGLASASAPATSSGNTIGNFYEVRIRNGIDGIIMNPQPIESWRQTQNDVFNAMTIIGKPTIYIYNSALGGGNNLSYSQITKYAPKMLMPLVIIGLSYNEQFFQGKTYLASFTSLINAIKGYVDNPIITLISQAPTIAPAQYINPHKIRVNEILGYSVVNNYDNINFYEAFIESGIELSTLLNVDGLHPSIIGQELMLNSAYKYFNS